MTRESLFPDYYEADRDERLSRQWDFDWLLPVPQLGFRPCPHCSGAQAIKDWRFHRNSPSPTQWRCDIRTKCMECSLVLTYGIPVPERMYRAVRDKGLARFQIITWRLGQAALRSEGYFK